MSIENQVVEDEGWYGFDLDGTLATYNSQQWPKLGEPIKPMVDLVKSYLKRGLPVRIVTARAGDWSQRQAIQLWCLAHIGKVLPITNAKDYQMILLYDDRAVQVEKNTGRIIGAPNEIP